MIKKNLRKLKVVGHFFRGSRSVFFADLDPDSEKEIRIRGKMARLRNTASNLWPRRQRQLGHTKVFLSLSSVYWSINYRTCLKKSTKKCLQMKSNWQFFPSVFFQCGWITYCLVNVAKSKKFACFREKNFCKQYIFIIKVSL